MRVLVACEFSGVVRDAFAALGHDAWSCDLLDTESPGKHIIGDANEIIKYNWDLMIAHPPCTYLCNSGVRWLYKRGRGTERDEERWEEMEKAVQFFNTLLSAPIPKIAIENPIQHSYATERITAPVRQIIQPWQFGVGESKRLCLWLKNLPRLRQTEAVKEQKHRVHWEPDSKDRWKKRSRTHMKIAQAMAAQWGTRT